MLSMHLRIAALALLPLLIWGAYRMVSDERAQLLRPAVEIGVEHGGQGGISITHGIGGRTHLTDIGNDGEEAIHVSLPEAWERGEVRGAPLSSLVADAPSFGFRRWSLPAGATVTFRTPHDWTNLTIHNPSGELLRVKLTTVDLAKDETTTDVYLLNDTSRTFSR